MPCPALICPPSEPPAGAVLSWCPKNTVLRKVLGSLKDKAEPEALPVYPVRMKGSAVWVNLSTPPPKAA